MKIKFNNQDITLPKFTIEFEAKLDDIRNANIDLKKLQTTRTEVIKKVYDFLISYLGDIVNKVCDGTSLNDIDTRLLELLFFEVNYTLDQKLEDAQIEKNNNKLNVISNNSNLKKVTEFLENINKANV